ncbi:MAG: hypothetical protein AAFZ49_13280 [Cyanobacteria bacterium J06659_2]
MKFQPWMLAGLLLVLFGLGAVSTLTNPEIQEGRALQLRLRTEHKFAWKHGRARLTVS